MEKSKLFEALLSTDKIAVRNFLLNSGKWGDPIEIIENMIVPVLEEIGVGWEAGEVALSQVYMSGRIVEDIVDEILPSSDPKRKSQPKIAIAVLNDYHFLGKRIVYSYVRASGYSLLDLKRVTVDELISKIIDESLSLVLISTLMLPSALDVKKVKAKLISLGNPCKIIVGGAPFRFDKDLYKEVGADATAVNIADIISTINAQIEDL